MRDQAQKSTRIALDSAVFEEARRLGVNISKAAESGVLAAIRAERARAWQQENAEAIAEYNAQIEANGLPLAEYRKF